MKKEKHGGFAIEFSKRGKQEFMTAEGLAGTWKMVLRGDTEVFQVLKAFWEEAHNPLCEDKESFINYVVHYVRMNFICSSVSPDEQFTTAFVNAYNEYCDRLHEVRGTVVEDTEEEIIKEEIVKHQLSVELKDEIGKHSADDSENVGNDSELSNGDSASNSALEQG